MSMLYFHNQFLIIRKKISRSVHGHTHKPRGGRPLGQTRVHIKAGVCYPAQKGSLKKETSALVPSVAASREVISVQLMPNRKTVENCVIIAGCC